MAPMFLFLWHTRGEGGSTHAEDHCTHCPSHPLSERWDVGQVVDLCASLIGALSEVRLGKVADHFFTVRARSCRLFRVFWTLNPKPLKP